MKTDKQIRIEWSKMQSDEYYYQKLQGYRQRDRMFHLIKLDEDFEYLIHPLHAQIILGNIINFMKDEAELLTSERINFIIRKIITPQIFEVQLLLAKDLLTKITANPHFDNELDFSREFVELLGRHKETIRDF